MNLIQNKIDLQILLDQFTASVRALNTSSEVVLFDNDHSVFIYFQNLLPDKFIQQMDFFLLISTLIPHFAPAYYDQLFDELLGEGNFPELGGGVVNSIEVFYLPVR